MAKKKKTKFGKFGNPFKMSREQKRHANRQRLEGMARVIKKMTKSKKSIKHIAADLSLAEFRRKK